MPTPQPAFASSVHWHLSVLRCTMQGVCKCTSFHTSTSSASFQWSFQLPFLRQDVFDHLQTSTSRAHELRDFLLNNRQVLLESVKMMKDKREAEELFQFKRD